MGQEPENFCLVALTAVEDPGLFVLPIHRLIRSDIPLESLRASLLDIFEVEVAPNLESLLAMMEQRRHLSTALGLAAAESPDLYLLTLLDREAIAERMPPGTPAAWRSVDTAVVQYCLLEPALGIDQRAVAAGVLQYTEDAQAATEAVRAGRYRYALLLNAVPPSQMLAVADTGHRLPQKSTYFYPKVPAGLVLNLLDA
jgi:uncharacterized protein (DUF1015 family)